MAAVDTSAVSRASSLEEPQLTSWHVDPVAASRLRGKQRNEYNGLVNKLADHIVELGKELKCPVCLSLMSDPTQCPCGHVFCRDCILQALAIAKHCPLCRTKCTKREISVSYVYEGIINTYRAIQPEGMDVGSEFTQPTTFSQICGAMAVNHADSSFESKTGADAAGAGQDTLSSSGHLLHGVAAGAEAAAAAAADESSAHLFDSDEDDDFIRGGISAPSAGALPSLPSARQQRGTEPARPAAASNPAGQPSHTHAINPSHMTSSSTASALKTSTPGPAAISSQPAPQPAAATAPRRAKSRSKRKPMQAPTAVQPSGAAAAASAASAVREAEVAAATSAMHGLLASVVVLVENLPRQFQKQLDKLQSALGDDVMRVTSVWSQQVTHCIVPVKAVRDPRGAPTLSTEGAGKRRRSGGKAAAQVLVARRRSDAYLLSLAHGAELVSPAWISAGVAEKPYVLVAEAPYRLAGDEESLKSAITASALLNAGPPAALRSVASDLPRPLQGWSVAMCGLFQYPIPIEKNTATLLQAMGALVLLPSSDKAAFDAFIGAACGAACDVDLSDSTSQPGLVLLLDDSKEPCAIPKFLEEPVVNKIVAGFGGPVYAPSVRWLLDVVCSYTALDPTMQEFEAVFRVTGASAAQHT